MLMTELLYCNLMVISDDINSLFSVCLKKKLYYSLILISER